MHRRIVCALLSISCALAQEKSPEPSRHFAAGEYDAYTAASKALASNQFQTALDALDAWKQKVPDSDYRDDRQAIYVQTFAGLNQPAKALDAASPLLARDLTTVFTDSTAQPTILRLYYTASWAISRIPDPTPEQLSIGEKAARSLLAWEQPLPGVPADKWAEARNDMRDKAGAALLSIAMVPGIRAMAKQPPDCASAESSYRKALVDDPDKSVVSYELARAATCETKDDPAKATLALFEFERAAVIDPTLGGVRSDPKQVQSYADNAYVKFHGGKDGLEELKQLAKQSALPPDGLTIASSAQIAEQKKAAFDTENPEFALWLKIRTALAQPDGAAYFEKELKGAAVPKLEGRLVTSTPACRPRELAIAVPLPESLPDAAPEITLHLDKPLEGRPEPGQLLMWEGVPSRFTEAPLLLTMDVRAAEIKDLKVSPCGAIPKAKPRQK